LVVIGVQSLVGSEIIDGDKKFQPSKFFTEWPGCQLSESASSYRGRQSEKQDLSSEIRSCQFEQMNH